MGQTIGSGNKPSSVALHQNHAIVFIYRNAWIKYQILILYLNMPKTKWEGVEEPTINTFYKTDKHNILHMLLKVRIYQSKQQYFSSTEVDRNTTWCQVPLGTLMVHQQRHMPSQKNNKNECSKLVSTIYQVWGKMEYGLDDRFG